MKYCVRKKVFSKWRRRDRTIYVLLTPRLARASEIANRKLRLDELRVIRTANPRRLSLGLPG